MTIALAGIGSIRKVYRLALYGRRSSGKTCILCALAMSRISHPDGLTCTWIENPLGVKRPPDYDNLPPNDPATPYHRGHKWLEDAIRALERGDNPPPNRNEAGAVRLIFEFTSPDQRSYHVELIDYSGELIEGVLSDDDLAERLREHLVEMDGILVLAEVARPGEPMGDAFKEMDRLRRTFVELRNRKKHGPMPDTPVALVFNKWDCVSTLTRFNPEDAALEIDEFLRGDPEPPHRGLANALAGPEEKGNYHAFPVSAFGPKAVRGQGGKKDRPAQVNPLLSYGLEDPFVWACRRRDQVELEQLEDAAKRLRWWKLWQLGGSQPARTAARLAAELKPRFPAGSEERRRVNRQVWHSFTAAAGRCVLAASLLFGLVLGSEAVWDDHSYKDVQATLKNPQEADNDRIAQAETWLETYYKAPAYRHSIYGLAFARSEAWKQLNDVRVVREDRAWEAVKKNEGNFVAQLAAAEDMESLFPNSEKIQELRNIKRQCNQELARKLREETFAQVLSAPDEVTKEERAKTYSFKFPDGEHRPQCDAIVQDALLGRQKRQNEDALAKLENDLKRLIENKNEQVPEYSDLRRRADAWPPVKDIEKEDQLNRRTALVNNIGKRLGEIETLVLNRQIEENKDFLNRVSNTLNKVNDEKRLRELQVELKKGLPNKDAAITDELRRELEALVGRTTDKLAAEIARKDWVAFKSDYNSLMQQGDLRGAAKHLTERSPEMDPLKELNELKNGYVARSQQSWSRKLKTYEKNSQWGEARDEVKRLDQDLAVRALLSEAERGEFEATLSKLAKKVDKDLYDDAKSSRSQASLEAYREKAPLKSMKKDVDDLLAWQKKIKGPLELLAEASVSWGGNCWDGYKNSVVIKMDNAGLITGSDVKSSLNAKSDVGSAYFTRKLDDTVTVSVAIKVTDGFFPVRSREHGFGSFTARVSELKSGKTIGDLGEYGFGNSFTIRLVQSSIPAEPVLRDWKED